MRMSNAVDGNVNDHVDVQHGQTELFQTLQPIAWASGQATWSLQLVMRDKPDVISPITVDVWSQSGTCTSPGAVPATQRYASGTVNLPVAVDKQGVAVGIAGTGALQHSFVVGEVMCMAIVNANGSGNGDLHVYSDTFSTSGLTGRSAIFGSFSFGTAPYILHQQSVAGAVRSMSTSASGAVNDQVAINAGNTVTFQSTSPIKDASGLSPWPLHIVIRDPLALLGSGQAQVWKQSGACTTYASVPVAQRLASGTFSVPTSLTGNNGVSVSIPGTGAALSTFATSDVLCVALSNTGLGNWTLRVDTPAATGTAGVTTLGGPFSQVAGLRAYGPNGERGASAPWLPLLAAWLILAGGAGAWWRLMRRR